MFLYTRGEKLKYFLFMREEFEKQLIYIIKNVSLFYIAIKTCERGRLNITI
jgi:hypothetical protein